MERTMSFLQPGKASFLVGGQWGSEGKGAAAAWIAQHLAERRQFFSIVTTNAGAQAGHTSVHVGVRRVVFHLPTAPLVAGPAGTIYLNAGSVIDLDVLEKELKENLGSRQLGNFFIHPNAAVITDECRAAEGRISSQQTIIASTRKGVGEALSRKALRTLRLARDEPRLRPFVRRIDLNVRLRLGASVLVEVPQGFSLSLNGKFYPHCTSRDCTVQQAMSDAGIHPQFYGQSCLVIRTFPIRVGNIYDDQGKEVGNSGQCYPDQHETSWEELNVPPEITTVTKRVRRVFTFSRQQLIDAMAATQPDVVYLTFCDYSAEATDRVKRLIGEVSVMLGLTPNVIMQSGPTTSDAVGSL